MCGIAGFLETGAHISQPATVVARMTRQLAHRGPDDEGVWVDEDAGIALGQRRLSIIDLSPHGHQPMFSSTGRYSIVFNGEIYNFAALRKEMDGSAEFRGGSDTEVILAAIERWGIEPSLRRFNGMFAFALWDRLERRLTLARDRLGEKPLYYGWAGTTFVFASELKALRVHPRFDPRIDRDVLALYFRYNYVPGPYSIHERVWKLPPGAWFSLGARDGLREPRPGTYWSAFETMRDGLDQPYDVSQSEALDALDDRLRATVQSRMVADVPLGAFLSGGIDSSLIVALMQAGSSRASKTFTIGFEDPKFNEADHARAVAKHLQTDHTELRVTPGDALSVIPRLGGVYDEPFADASQIPTLLIASLARKFVTVALTGDGGDELFGGYTRYSWHQSLWRVLEGVPSPARAAMSLLLSGVPRPAWEATYRLLEPIIPQALRQRNPGENLERLRTILHAGDARSMYRDLISIWPDAGSLVRGGSEAPDAVDPVCSSFSPTLQLMLADTLGNLPGDILVKVDRASMSVGLETRAPLLDHEVFEFAARLPLSMKIRNGQGKWILKRLLDRYVPREMMERPKRGFAVPLDGWLRGRLRPWAEELLSGKRLAEEGFLNVPVVRRKWAEHLSGRQNWMYPLWGVLMFQLWLDTQRIPQVADESRAAACPVLMARQGRF